MWPLASLPIRKPCACSIHNHRVIALATVLSLGVHLVILGWAPSRVAHFATPPGPQVDVLLLNLVEQVIESPADDPGPSMSAVQTPQSMAGKRALPTSDTPPDTHPAPLVSTSDLNPMQPVVPSARLLRPRLLDSQRQAFADYATPGCNRRDKATMARRCQPASSMGPAAGIEPAIAALFADTKSKAKTIANQLDAVDRLRQQAEGLQALDPSDPHQYALLVEQRQHLLAGARRLEEAQLEANLLRLIPATGKLITGLSNRLKDKE